MMLLIVQLMPWPDVYLSVQHIVYCIETSKHTVKRFLPSGSHSTFAHKTLGRDSDGVSLNEVYKGGV